MVHSPRCTGRRSGVARGRWGPGSKGKRSQPGRGRPIDPEWQQRSQLKIYKHIKTSISSNVSFLTSEQHDYGSENQFIECLPGFLEALGQVFIPQDVGSHIALQGIWDPGGDGKEYLYHLSGSKRRNST